MSVRVTTPAIGPDGRHPRHAASRERRARRLGRRRLALRARRRARPLASPRAHGLQGHRRRRSAADIAEEIEAVGGEVNAATSVETTSYYARVLKDDVPLALDILCDILRNSVFDPEELTREQHVILQEIGAAHDTPEDRVFDLFAEAAFPTSRSAAPSSARAETVKAAASPMLGAYLDRHYRGPSMVIAAAGAVDHDELVDLAERALRRPRRRGRPDAGRRDLSRRRDARGARPAGDPDHAGLRRASPIARDDFYTAQVLSSILGGGMSSRLFQEVREKRGLCYSIYAFHWSFADTGIFGVHAATGPEDVDELMPVDRRRARARRPTTITDKEAEARPGAAPRRPADDARKPGRPRRPDRPAAPPLRPAASRSRSWSRGSRRSTRRRRPRPRRAHLQRQHADAGQRSARSMA